MNKVELIGEVAFLPVEVKYTSNGNAYCNTTIKAPYTIEDGREFTSYVPVKAWGKEAERLGQATQGEQLTMTGYINKSKWTDKEGNNRYNTEVTLQSISGADGNESAPF